MSEKKTPDEPPLTTAETNVLVRTAYENGERARIEGFPANPYDEPKLRDAWQQGFSSFSAILQSMPKTTWEDIETGVPVRFQGWRSIDMRSPLARHHRDVLGRDWLFGDGIYVFATLQMAAKYGASIRQQIVLYNPYALRIPQQADWIWVIKQLDLEAIRRVHDGIVIVAGKTRADDELLHRLRRDLRQAVIFEPSQVSSKGYRPRNLPDFWRCRICGAHTLFSKTACQKCGAACRSRK